MNVLSIARHARSSAGADAFLKDMQTTHQTHEEHIPAARIYIEPGFAWDGQEAYLFDIDGTLLRNRDRIHRESFVIGVQQVTGYDIQPFLFLTPGGTDPVILARGL